jgi:hypothetical protein
MPSDVRPDVWLAELAAAVGKGEEFNHVKRKGRKKRS